MKIAIIGSGAMGTLFAGFLAKCGNDVSILTRNKKTEKIIGKKGIKVTGITKISVPPSKINVTSNPAGIFAPDLIIIFVKSYDTISTISQIKKMSDKNTAVLTLQNGLGNYEILSKYIGKKRIIRGTTSESATLVKYGEIIRTGIGKTVIEKNNVSGRIAGIFNKCGIKTVLNGKIEQAIWSKLVLNCAVNPVAAISKVKNGEIIKYKSLLEVAVESGVEVAAVAKKLKIKILFTGVSEKIEELCRATSENINSMLADITAGKKTEIDSLNGAVVNIAEKLKMPVPVNKSLHKIVKIL